jgi:hypothetical protein
VNSDPRNRASASKASKNFSCQPAAHSRYRERVDPGGCWIGRVQGIDRGRLSLLEIGPDAKWEDSPEEYRVAEITRVNFGGDYENALHLVGGDPVVESSGR